MRKVDLDCPVCNAHISFDVSMMEGEESPPSEVLRRAKELYRNALKPVTARTAIEQAMGEWSAFINQFCVDVFSLVYDGEMPVSDAFDLAIAYAEKKEEV